MNADSQNHEIFTVDTSDEVTWHNTRVFDLTYFSRSQRSNSKISPKVARLLTSESRKLKLGVWMSYDNMTWHTKNHRNLTYFLGSRRPSLKILFCQYLMNADSQYCEIFIVDTSDGTPWHFPRVYDLTYFSRSQRSNYKIFTMVARFVIICPRVFKFGM